PYSARTLPPVIPAGRHDLIAHLLRSLPASKGRERAQSDRATPGKHHSGPRIFRARPAVLEAICVRTSRDGGGGSVNKNASQDRRGRARESGEGQRPQNTSRRKGRSAAAVLLRVRVFEDEPRLHQRLFVVERHATQVDDAFGIDEDLHAVEVKNTIV